MNFWIKSVDTDLKRYKIIYDFRKSFPVFSHPLSLFLCGVGGSAGMVQETGNWRVIDGKKRKQGGKVGISSRHLLMSEHIWYHQKV